MSDFKIIAMRPLEGCDPDYLKILKPGELYKLCNDYEFTEDTIKYNSTIPKDLFNQGELNINVSAIVGKNGSGKSTIIDLILMGINNISFCYSKLGRIETVELIPVLKLNIDLYIKTDSFYKIQFADKRVTIYNYEELNGVAELSDEVFDIIITEEKTKDDTIFDICRSNYNDKLKISDLFYTICTNYSHYALNSEEYGPWVSQVFHKNDSYQAPLVVNPYRKKGNVDINSETHLMKSRLLSYLLEPKKCDSHRMLTEQQKATNAIFKLNEKKISYAYKVEIFSPKYQVKEISWSQFESNGLTVKNIISIICRIFNFSSQEINQSSVFKNDVKKYIVRKLISITQTYHKYRDYYSVIIGESSNGSIINNEYIYVEDLIEELKVDESHVTFKLKQAINFLKKDVLSSSNNINDKKAEIVISFQKLQSRINKTLSNKEKVMNYLPPAIFDFDIEIRNEESNSNSYKFSNLSSGEKQRIYSVYSILYHIYNIDSVSSELVNYKSINLIFEEVELYFHPDMQKGLLNYLLNRLSQQSFDNIENINICFVTHSPFILSDIPNSNILFLNVEKGQAVPFLSPPKTFGANIHDLLKNGFFMKNGVMGEFAVEEINRNIKFISDHKTMDITKEEENNLKKMIGMLGEPLLKRSMNKLFYESFFRTDEDIDREIEMLKKIKKTRAKK